MPGDRGNDSGNWGGDRGGGNHRGNAGGGPGGPAGAGSAHSLRVVSVPLRRLHRWLAGFEARHREAVTDPNAGGWSVAAADGARAAIRMPPWVDAAIDPGTPAPTTLEALAELAPCFGVLAIRRAGYAVALLDGPRTVEQKVGRRHIHGRTAAGGWSQQRYARRRANQADEIAAAVADTADRIIGATSSIRPRARFLATGGDRGLLEGVLGLAGPAVSDLPRPVHLAIGAPDASVLAGVADRVLAVDIELRDP